MYDSSVYGSMESSRDTGSSSREAVVQRCSSGVGGSRPVEEDRDSVGSEVKKNSCNRFDRPAIVRPILMVAARRALVCWQKSTRSWGLKAYCRHQT